METISTSTATPQKEITLGIHASDKLTRTATRVDTDKVDTQNLGSITVFLRGSFRIITCNGRLIAQINTVVIKAIKTNSTTNHSKAKTCDHRSNGASVQWILYTAAQ
jgi:hypothetical protein